MDHPTQGRRRRHKSPSSIPAAPLLPVPRLADHLDTNDGPSDEEGEKDAKRQRSEPTTPISASSRTPNEYDEVMGITQVDPREAEGLKRGLNRGCKIQRLFAESDLLPIVAAEWILTFSYSRKTNFRRARTRRCSSFLWRFSLGRLTL